MAETASQKSATPRNEPVQGRRKEVVGEVVANRMQKTIVVKVTRKKAHPFYGRVVARNKKFYAHDEKNEAHVGDVVRIEETRPLSKLKRWKLKDIVRKTTLVPEIALERDDKGQAKSQSKGPGKDKSKLKSETKSE